MKLVPLDNVRTLTITDGRMDITLDCGIRMNSYFHLDGGGLIFKDDLLDSIIKYGKSEYNRGLEWCSGFGVFGFEALGRGIAKHMTFSDYYDVAINDCYRTARINNIEDKVNGYITPAIGTIPSTEIWDLVISNPPHAFCDTELTRSSLPGTDVTGLDNTLRVLVDEGMAAHKEFFLNIKKHLTDDADIFIYEPEVFNELIQLAEDGGLYLHGKYPLDHAYKKMPHWINGNIHSEGKICHFKVKAQ